MIILDYDKKHHNQIINACIGALRAGKILAYPTDTSYGLACDITNPQAVSKFYRIKERAFNKPVHIVIPEIAYAKSVAEWNRRAGKLARAFWPGPLSIVLPRMTHSMEEINKALGRFSAGTNTVGLRMPKNKIAMDLVRGLGEPIPATSANPGGGYDSYSAEDISDQFKKKKYKPDILLNAGKLPKRKPSTLVKITADGIEVLREGPISEKQIRAAVSL